MKRKRAANAVRCAIGSNTHQERQTMRFSIIQTNRTTESYPALDARTGIVETRYAIHEPGHIIAEHNSPETTAKHAERLRKRFQHIEFEVKEDAEFANAVAGLVRAIG